SNSDRESGHAQMVMSALPLKADMCGATGDVCYGPKADICSAAAYVRFTPTAPANADIERFTAYSRTVSARVTNDFGNVIPSALAAFRLTANSNRVGRSIGKSVAALL